MVKHVSTSNINESFNLTRLNWLWLAVIVFIIDLFTKCLVFYNFLPGEKISLLPLLNLYYICNYGAAFGFFSDSSRHHQWLFFGIITSISLMLIMIIYHLKNIKKINSISFALITGGALGNLLDRLLHGFVIDMIDFHIGEWHFATFNFADSAIFTGTFLIILEGFFLKRKFIWSNR